MYSMYEFIADDEIHWCLEGKTPCGTICTDDPRKGPPLPWVLPTECYVCFSMKRRFMADIKAGNIIRLDDYYTLRAT